MTKQTEKIHIIDLSQEIIERLEYINIKPDSILTYSEDKIFSIDELKKLYPTAIINPIDKSAQADLIFAVFTENTSDIGELLKKFKDKLNPSALLMFAGLNINYILQDIGDFLLNLGYVNIVMDKEVLSDSVEVIYGHAWEPQPEKPVKIPLNQILRPPHL